LDNEIDTFNFFISYAERLNDILLINIV